MDHRRPSRSLAHELRHQPWVCELEIRAAEARRAGVCFYRGNERVWLSDAVPPAHREVAG